MKHFFTTMLALAVCTVSALNLPKSISAKCGNVELRFDSLKFWNINSIIYKGERMATDYRGAHYGMVYTMPRMKGFIGSGHTETGVSEVVKSLRFKVDGKEVAPAEKLPEGKTLYLEKHSIIGNFEVFYTMTVKDDAIGETTRIKALKKTTVSVIYCFMHPWVTEFDRFYAYGSIEPEIFQKMEGKDRWYMDHKDYPVIALLNTKTASAVTSKVWFKTKPQPGYHTGRILRDSTVYRKDYYIPFCNTTLPQGLEAEVASEIRFYKSDEANFIKDAKKIFPVNISQTIPPSITAKCGNVEVRFDSLKFWNINSVIYKGEKVGTDLRGAHYGMVYRSPGMKGFIGSGHTETGSSEEVKELRFFVDGKLIHPTKKLPESKTLVMEKLSTVGNVEVFYRISIKDDIISETTKLKVLKKTVFSVLYCFMHPWSTEFTRFYGFGGDKPVIDAKMVSDNKFPMNKYYPYIALFNPKTGTALATEMKFVSQPSAGYHTGRLMWDRQVYRKDYFVPFSNTTLNPGFESEVAAETRFFKTSDANFIKDAEKIFPAAK